MIKKSVLNKLNKPLAFIASAVGIVTSSLSLIGIIPSQVRSNLYFKIGLIVTLIFGGILLFRFLIILLKSSSKSLKIVWYGFTVSLFSFLIISTIFYQDEKPLEPITLVNSKSISNEQIQNSNIRKIELKDSSSHNHIISGDNNHVGVNGDVTYYINKSTPRKLNRKDINFILSSIPSKEFLVRINYPTNNQEAQLFSKQILDTLYRLGYSNISESNVSSSHAYFGIGRISVIKDSLPTPAIRLIINPQQ